jgi:hypothetical protein
MNEEVFENTVVLDKGDEMKVAAIQTMTTGQFQQHLMSSKTLKGKLAVCFKKLSESGTFSDSSPETFQFRSEIMEHLPEELRNG